MSNYCLLSSLQFSYPPLSAYEFDRFRKDVEIQKNLDNSCLYIIARRPLIQFCDYSLNSNERTISFNLFRKDVNYKLSCKFYVDSYEEFRNRNFKVLFGSFTKDSSKTHGLQFIDFETHKPFHWFNAEKFLYSVSHNFFKADIKGNMLDFLTFEVLYIGKCTDEPISKRFNHHHALQEILITENIITEDYQNSHELIILPFEYMENQIYKINYICSDSEQDQYIKISDKTIAIDEEKALIKCLNPRYNNVKYKSYPKSSDGLINQNISFINYLIGENLQLKYTDGIFIGNTNIYDSSISSIVVQGNAVKVLNN